MKPTNRQTTHPGVILWEEFLLQLPEISGDITKLTRYLSDTFQTTSGFWENLLDAYNNPPEKQIIWKTPTNY